MHYTILWISTFFSSKVLQMQSKIPKLQLTLPLDLILWSNKVLSSKIQHILPGYFINISFHFISRWNHRSNNLISAITLLFYCGTLLMSELWHCLILLGVLEVFWFYATLIIFVDNNNNNNNIQEQYILTRHHSFSCEETVIMYVCILYGLLC